VGVLLRAGWNCVPPAGPLTGAQQRLGKPVAPAEVARFGGARRGRAPAGDPPTHVRLSAGWDCAPTVTAGRPTVGPPAGARRGLTERDAPAGASNWALAAGVLRRAGPPAHA
jgi:hypothetical protein